MQRFSGGGAGAEMRQLIGEGIKEGGRGKREKEWSYMGIRME